MLTHELIKMHIVRALGVAGVGLTIPKFGTFFEKYVPNSMPIFEKKSHPIRPVEGLKLCHDFYVMQALNKNSAKVCVFLQEIPLVGNF